VSSSVLTVDQYRQHLLSLVDGWPKVESCDLAAAAGRTLAESVRAAQDLPPFANSAMDGFGIALGAAPTDRMVAAYQVVADLPAGRDPATGGPVGPGQAVRIMTGAALAPGVDTVVPLEDAVVEADTVRFVAPVRLGQHIRAAGEDLAAGAEVLQPGTRLAPRHLAAAAAAGWGQLQVAGRPRVAIVTTGDELADPGQRLGPATIADSNGPYLRAAVAAAGANDVGAWRVHDDPAELRSALDQAAGLADLIVVAGGVSAGDRDVTRALLAPTGLFTAVAMQPGKPQGYGRWADCPVVALPGNPVSVAVSFAVFVRPLLAAMLGLAPAMSWSGVVRRGWSSPAGRRQFMPVALSPGGDVTVALAPASAGGAGSHLVASLALADALAVVPEAVSQVKPGQRLELVELV